MEGITRDTDIFAGVLEACPVTAEKRLHKKKEQMHSNAGLGHDNTVSTIQSDMAAGA